MGSKSGRPSSPQAFTTVQSPIISCSYRHKPMQPSKTRPGPTRQRRQGGLRGSRLSREFSENYPQSPVQAAAGVEETTGADTADNARRTARIRAFIGVLRKFSCSRLRCKPLQVSRTLPVPILRTRPGGRRVSKLSSVWAPKFDWIERTWLNQCRRHTYSFYAR